MLSIPVPILYLRQLKCGDIKSAVLDYTASEKQSQDLDSSSLMGSQPVFLITILYL